MELVGNLLVVVSIIAGIVMAWRKLRKHSLKLNMAQLEMSLAPSSDKSRIFNKYFSDHKELEVYSEISLLAPMIHFKILNEAFKSIWPWGVLAAIGTILTIL